jgi:hypothetical protein
VGCLSTWWLFPLLCKAFAFHIVLFVNCWAIEVLLRKLLSIPICSSLFPILYCGYYKVLGHMFSSLIHLNRYWNAMNVRDLFSVFYMQIASFLSTISRFFIVCFGILCQKSGGYSCVDLGLGLLLCSSGLHGCFCASTMLFLLLCLCRIVWSQVLWFLQCCSFVLILHWIYSVFWAAIWTIGLIF